MRRALVAAAAALVIVAGCGKTNDSGMGPHDGSDKPDAAAKNHNAADVEFAQMMIPHHKQAVEMSTLAKTRTENAEVTELASTIEAAQGPEIEQMEGWLSSWGDEPMGMDHGAGHGDMPGMMDKDTMADLKKAKGSEFDKLFLESMIEHHEGAIEMAKREKSDGKHPAALALANAIIKSQSAEIDRMKKLLEA